MSTGAGARTAEGRIVPLQRARDGAAVPRLAAMLVVRTTVALDGELRGRLMITLADYQAARIDSDASGLAVEFASARAALDCARRLVHEHGAVLRIGVAIGEISGEAAGTAGDALSDAQAVAATAVPGGLAISAALRDTGLVRLDPELAALMHAGEAPLDVSAPRAYLAAPAALARLRMPEPPRPSQVVRLRQRRWGALLAIGVVLLVAAGVAWRSFTPPTALARDPSIAVLPFESLSDVAEERWFAEGLGDELVDQLAGTEGLRVAARASGYALRGKGLDVKALGERLGVATVLDATVRRYEQQGASRVRIAARLSDTASGFTLWSSSYDRRFDDVFAIQSEIATEVSRTLLGMIAGRRATPVAVAPDAAAYQQYLTARRQLDLPVDASAITRAIAGFEQALVLDPGFARARAGICVAEMRRFDYAREGAAQPRAREACDAAVAAGAALPEVHLALGDLARGSGDCEAARREFGLAMTQKALRADALLGMAKCAAAEQDDVAAEDFFEQARREQPSFWAVYYQRGNFLSQRRRIDEAVAAYRTAMGLAPPDRLANVWNAIGMAYTRIDDNERAADALQQSVNAGPSPTPSTLSNLGSLRFQSGDYRAAAAAYRQGAALRPEDYRMWGNLGDALAADATTSAQAGDAYERARELLALLLAGNRDDPEANAVMAWYHANLGDSDQARRLLAHAAEVGPEHPDVCYYGAQTSARLGDEAQARRWIALGLSAGVSYRMLATAPGLRPLMPPPAAGNSKP